MFHCHRSLLQLVGGVDIRARFVGALPSEHRHHLIFCGVYGHLGGARFAHAVRGQTLGQASLDARIIEPMRECVLGFEWPLVLALIERRPQQLHVLARAGGDGFGHSLGQRHLDCHAGLLSDEPDVPAPMLGWLDQVLFAEPPDVGDAGTERDQDLHIQVLHCAEPPVVEELLDFGLGPDLLLNRGMPLPKEIWV